MNAAPRILAALMTATTLAILPACKTTEPSQYTYSPPKPAPKKLGSVAFVNQSDGFVLVRMNYGYSVDPGTTLYAVGPDGAATAKLARDPDEKRPFVVANILAGNPANGDSVLLFPDPAMAPAIGN